MTDEWVYFSAVIRAPNPAVASGVTFSLTVRDPSVRLDNLRVIELDGALRNVDEDSVTFWTFLSGIGYIELDGGCFDVDADGANGADIPDPATAPDPEDLGWHPVFDLAASSGVLPDVTDYRASIEVLSSSCDDVDGFYPGVWTDTAPVYVSYRTWTHAGLWPGFSERQDGYVYSPNVFEPDFWSDPMSPEGQMQSLAAAPIGRSSMALNPDLRDEFILVSDLGGEIRGFNRAWDVELVDNAEKFASYYCKVKESACDAFGTSVGPPMCNGTCDSMFLPVGAGFAPCDCSGWTGVPAGPNEYRLLIAGDMFNRWHNGDRFLYQVPYGGVEGESTDARDAMPADTVFLAWWHSDAQRNASQVVGHEMSAALIEDFMSASKSVIGATAWDPENIRTWSAMAAAGPMLGEGFPAILGLAHYGWGSDDEGPDYMAQAGHYAWQAEWQTLRTWFLSSDPNAPGGDETALPPHDQWFSAGFGAPVDDQVLRPPVGQRLETLAGATWVSPWVPVDHSLLVSPPVGGPVWSWNEPWAQVLLRFYAELPSPQCSLEVEFEFKPVVGGAPWAVAGTLQQDSSAPGWANDEHLWAWSAVAPLEYSSGSPPGDLLVRGRVEYVLCALPGSPATFDNPTLYQGRPFIDFPYAYEEQSLDQEWQSSSAADTWNKTCGTTPSSPLCMHVDTMKAR